MPPISDIGGALPGYPVVVTIATVNPTTGQTTDIPGAIGDIQGRRGTTFAVQSTWSNRANEGTGYCEGVNNSPLPNG